MAVLLEIAAETPPPVVIVEEGGNSRVDVAHLEGEGVLILEASG